MLLTEVWPIRCADCHGGVTNWKMLFNLARTRGVNATALMGMNGNGNNKTKRELCKETKYKKNINLLSYGTVQNSHFNNILKPDI